MRTFFVRVGQKFVNVGGGHIVWVSKNGSDAQSLVKVATGDVISVDEPLEDLMVRLEKASAFLGPVTD